MVEPPRGAVQGLHAESEPHKPPFPDLGGTKEEDLVVVLDPPPPPRVLQEARDGPKGMPQGDLKEEDPAVPTEEARK
ncbi:MAG TPA: hypothetical protein EYP61_05755 [Candidatus Latescibacteria bacterium]|nr:hypothetical protein [Candidatus Latescibacterota bacterium]